MDDRRRAPESAGAAAQEAAVTPPPPPPHFRPTRRRDFDDDNYTTSIPQFPDMQHRAARNLRALRPTPSEPPSSGTTRIRDLALLSLPTALAMRSCM